MQNSQLKQSFDCECHVLCSVKPALGGLLHAWPAIVCMLPAACTAHAPTQVTEFHLTQYCFILNCHWISVSLDVRASS